MSGATVSHTYMSDVPFRWRRPFSTSARPSHEQIVEVERTTCMDALDEHIRHLGVCDAGRARTPLHPSPRSQMVVGTLQTLRDEKWVCCCDTCTTPHTRMLCFPSSSSTSTCGGRSTTPPPPPPRPFSSTSRRTHRQATREQPPPPPPAPQPA